MAAADTKTSVASAPIDWHTLVSYYDKIFPWKSIERLFTRGGQLPISKRLYSLTSAGDTWLAPTSNSSIETIQSDAVRLHASTVHLNAIRHPPTASWVDEVIERELIFDIDLKDYDDLRAWFCGCRGKTVCFKCWCISKASALVLCQSLSDQFGYAHLMPVFSGGGGVHVWVLDNSAKSLSFNGREAIVEYHTFTEKKQAGGTPSPERSSVFARYTPDKLWPILGGESLLDHARGVFEDIFIRELDLMGSPKGIKEVLRQWELRDDVKREEGWPPEILSRLHKAVAEKKTGLDRWYSLYTTVVELEITCPHLGNALMAPLHNLILSCVMPRFDRNVTTELKHNIKSPLSPHPISGYISVPIPLHKLATFDIEVVPKIYAVEENRKLLTPFVLDLDRILSDAFVVSDKKIDF